VKKTAINILSLSLTGLILMACAGDSQEKMPSIGKVIDDYIAGALVCADVNRNNLADDGIENCVESDEQGGFKFSRHRVEPLVVTGGVDIGTGKPFKGILIAPPESRVVNPLTTLVASVQKEQDMNLKEAEKIVKEKLGLTSTNIELTSFDPLAELQFGTDDKTKKIAKEVLAQQTNVQIILAVTTTTIVSANPNNLQENEVTIEASKQIAKLMLRPNDGTTPISPINSKESIETIITEVAKETFITPQGENNDALNAVNTVATVVAQQTQETTQKVVNNIETVQLTTNDNALTAIKESNAGILLVTDEDNKESIKNIIKESIITGDTAILENINIATEIENSIDSLIERPIIKNRRDDETEIRPTGGQGGTN